MPDTVPLPSPSSTSASEPTTEMLEPTDEAATDGTLVVNADTDDSYFNFSMSTSQVPLTASESELHRLREGVQEECAALAYAQTVKSRRQLRQQLRACPTAQLRATVRSITPDIDTTLHSELKVFVEEQRTMDQALDSNKCPTCQTLSKKSASSSGAPETEWRYWSSAPRQFWTRSYACPRCQAAQYYQLKPPFRQPCDYCFMQRPELLCPMPSLTITEDRIITGWLKKRVRTSYFEIAEDQAPESSELLASTTSSEMFMLDILKVSVDLLSKEKVDDAMKNPSTIKWARARVFGGDKGYKGMLHVVYKDEQPCVWGCCDNLECEGRHDEKW